jgi:protease-4
MMITCRIFRRARDDNEIKAVILRIDSGGGSALASDLIAREVF